MISDTSKRMILVAGVALGAASAFATGGAKHPKFNFKGMWVEGCSCMAPCPCELTGPNMSCQGVGFLDIKPGTTFDGMKVTKAKIAWALKAGEWVTLYVDAPDATSRKAAEEMGRMALAAFGKMEFVKNAKISITGTNGAYTAMVDGGNVMTLKTTMWPGGDGKTPLTYSNINDKLHPTAMQGHTVSGGYSDGGHEFALKDSNAFYNPSVKTKGTM